MEVTKHFRLYFLLLLPILTSSHEVKPCQPNLLGYTWPEKDIFIEHGKSSLDLTCTITNPEELRNSEIDVSKHLKFEIGKKLLNSTIINSTSIRLHIEPEFLDISHDMYTCIYKNSEVCSNVVFVADPPNPYDFRCISSNLDNLTCTWKHPNNSIGTNYSIYYKISYDSPDNECPCPHEPKYNKKEKQFECVWTTSTKYRQSAQVFNFTLIGVNKLGRKEITMYFDHFANVLPKPPVGLTVVNSTMDSLFLRWSIPTNLQHKAIQYRVTYRCGLNFADSDKDQAFQLAAFNDTPAHKKIVTFELIGLLYAHDLCVINVSHRLLLENDDGMWSQNASLYAWTGSTIPGEGPKLDIGSFKHINDSAVRIYWHQVPDKYQNGVNLTYHINLVKGSANVHIDRTRILKNSVVVSNLSSVENYTFELWASNTEGKQRKPFAMITIPAQRKRPYQVRELKKIESTNGFKLQWKRRDLVTLSNYTVFWCREITKSFNEDCNGDWNWVTVPATESEYLYRDPNSNKGATYRVAISSNSMFGSSGMFFPTCEESGEQIPTINLDKPIAVSATTVKLKWMAKCSTEGISSYTIEYCIALSHRPDECQNGTKAKHIIRGSMTEYDVDELNPYETYSFTIYPNMKNGNKGKTSDPELVTTPEGKPTVPTKLVATNITNSSIAVTWTAPVKSNGFITYYIYYHNKTDHTKVPTNYNKTDFVLDNLQSYVNYSIYVLACTSKICSDRSNTIIVRTLMGVPSEIERPTGEFIASSEILIKWPKPKNPGGPVMYEFSLEENGIQTITENYNATNASYKCPQLTTKFSFQVRAVNLDSSTGKYFYGNWSKKYEGTCSRDMIWLYPVIIILAFVGLAVVTKKLYERCRNMMNVEEAKLPGALGNFPLQPQPPFERKLPSTPTKLPEPDKVSLLGKPGDLKNHYGDSSGCSSAQEGSVNSESDATVSAGSDSGTDQGELRRRPFRNSKTSLLQDASRSESFSQVGIESNSPADLDDVQPAITYSDLEPVEPQIPAYVTPQARSLIVKPPKDEPINNGYVQVSDVMKATAAAAQKRDSLVDSKLAYVTVGQMPMPKMNRFYNKED